MIRITNLTKMYKGGKKAVDDLSIHIKTGEVFGFIGPNGAGKTTTLKCLCGIIDFDFGEIIINSNLSIKTNSSECKEIIAYIPDNPDIYNNLKGIQYLNFIADIFKVSKSDREERIKKYSHAFDLTSDLGSIISSYSHGMRQKLVLISALIHQPKLIVLDEPFVGLDPSSSHKLREIMREMCDNGSSVLFSTHVLETAEKICDSIAIIKEGKIITLGNTKDIVGDSSLEEIFLDLVEA